MVTIVGGLIGYSYSFVFILLVQTFISSYLIVRGSTLIINLGFPNEIVLMQSVLGLRMRVVLTASPGSSHQATLGLCAVRVGDPSSAYSCPTGTNHVWGEEQLAPLPVH